MLSSSFVAAYFNSLNVENGFFLQILNERISSISFTIYFRKKSYLIAPVNDELGLYISYGLLLHWERKYIDKKFIDKKIMQSSLGVRALKWQDVEGLFEIWGCLLIIAVISLILEVISKNIGCDKSWKSHNKLQKRLSS